MMMFVRREGADVVQELGTQEGEATYWRKQVRGQFQQKNAKGFFAKSKVSGIQIAGGKTLDLWPTAGKCSSEKWDRPRPCCNPLSQVIIMLMTILSISKIAKIAGVMMMHMCPEGYFFATKIDCVSGITFFW